MSTGEQDRDWDRRADELAARALADGEPTRWFDELWSAAVADEVDTPWARTAPYPPVLEHVDGAGPGEGRAAVVVGAGLGADAELLAERGWRTTAFDVSASAVALARDRHPGSSVDHRVADLLALPDDLVGAFDLVVEVFTVQALPPDLRADAVAAVRSLLAPGGTLLAVQFVRERGSDAGDGPPWLLDEDEVRSFAAADVHLEALDRRPHPLNPAGPDTWVAVLRRAP
ncbi:class I SAM-dependent methyltransferase [Phycicoccus sonneratiae]|uniref:Class I SAM-dependent methyltransferase n=1 Tax=Phycicoccus sonneratiae TaxID=2807628 RepID=A0ABS2CKV7_9MICO|nr:class I SAM-dependent methyltransferase [Phycicoccus sonneraticus]MBM6399699.1 class I SAM-dependent methyltransferase [Phycicoccus sonneraticus]